MSVTHRGVANMPGPGGSLGLCALCGETFLAEILLGTHVSVLEVEGFNKDLCFHKKCVEVLKQNGKDWRSLPDGPLRRAYEKAAQAQEPR
jgi:hypothetical protein